MSYHSRAREGESYRPHYRRDDDRPPPPPANMFQFRGAAGTRNHGEKSDRSDFTFRSRPKTSERPLLKTLHGAKEEKVLNTIGAQEEKFRNLDELTDSDEAEMDQSDEDTNEQPALKRARFGDISIDDQPKWSNPDVYTSLPAPSETTGKKLDFVKLIRKARNANTKASDFTTNDEDFISFDHLDEPDAAPSNAIDGSRAKDNDVALGKRKRGDNTGAKMIRRRGGGFYEDGMILDEWRVKANVHPTPWLQLHRDDNAGLALHKEILDFYDWVRPRDYESEVRGGVIQRLSAALNRIEPGELKAFGSYAAGLYLPTGDMDLVYLPRGFNHRRGLQVGISSNQFRKYGDFVKRSGIAQNGSVILIGRAKVPIIKFIERVSGLKVDLSFNNDTGVVAIETFRAWREQYPAMPIIVSIIKQFLMIRGLNDVAVGGLGGFSVICLVTSILQHMPATSTSGNLGNVLIEFFNIYGNLFDRDTVAVRLDPPGYIKKDLYVPLWSVRERAGRLTIVDPNRADNNISGGSHAIGTIFTCFSRAHEVLQNRLADYHAFDGTSGQGFSFLQDLVGGDFGAYQTQRDILYGLSRGQNGPAPAVVPPPPPPAADEPLPPPPPPPVSSVSNGNSKKRNVDQPAASHTDQSLSTDDAQEPTKSGYKKPPKATRRANRLKMLRPELAPVIPKSISLGEAIKIGGYKDSDDLQEDLKKRESEMKRR